MSSIMTYTKFPSCALRRAICVPSSYENMLRLDCFHSSVKDHLPSKTAYCMCAESVIMIGSSAYAHDVPSTRTVAIRAMYLTCKTLSAVKNYNQTDFKLWLGRRQVYSPCLSLLGCEKVYRHRNNCCSGNSGSSSALHFTDKGKHPGPCTAELHVYCLARKCKYHRTAGAQCHGKAP